MEFDIRNLDTLATKYDVMKAIQAVLHVCPGPFVTDEEQRPPNFDVTLHKSDVCGFENNGAGLFTVPKSIGKKFDRLCRNGEIAIFVKERKLKFISKGITSRRDLQITLDKAPYVDPEIDRQRQNILNLLHDGFTVLKVQIGQHLRLIYTSL